MISRKAYAGEWEKLQSGERKGIRVNVFKYTGNHVYRELVYLFPCVLVYLYFLLSKKFAIAAQSRANPIVT